MTPDQQAELEQEDFYCPSGGHKMNAIDPKQVVGLMRWWCPKCNLSYSCGFAISKQKIAPDSRGVGSMTPECRAALEQAARAYIQCLPFTGTLGEYDNAVRKLVTLLATQRAAVLEEAAVEMETDADISTASDLLEEAEFFKSLSQRFRRRAQEQRP
jgi:hypothetical protein